MACVAVSPTAHTPVSPWRPLLWEGLWASVKAAPGREPQQKPGDQLSLRGGYRSLS